MADAAAKLRMIAISQPTPEELYESCSAAYERAAFTYIDNWPEDVRALSFPTKLVPVETVLMRDLFGEGHEREIAAPKIAEILDAEMGWQEWFVRLNSRSPKDATWPGLPVTCSGKQAVFWLGGSERMLDDVCVLHNARKPLYVCLREWRRMHKDFEYRCFAKGGEVIAVSRYFYSEAPGGELQAANEVWDAAARFYGAHLARHYPEVVFDLYAPGLRGETLIEINPYGLSDPCCFGSYAAVEQVGGVLMECAQSSEAPPLGCVGEAELSTLPGMNQEDGPA